MNLSSGLLLSKDGFQWTLHGNLHVFVEKVTPGSTNGLAEPSIVQLAGGEIFMLLRSGSSRHYEARSQDGGITWTHPVPSALVGHNTPVALWRVEKSPDEIVAVWNNSPINRFPLSAALSRDGGRTWSPPRILAQSNGPQVSYPGLTQAADGTLVAVWQAQREDGGRDIRCARFTRDWLVLGR
jgi:predicted neuraminidase